MGLALYRKYRPKKLADVVGQDAIVQTLQQALKSNNVSHAYLFTGPRGVGKTSIARILAHEINDVPYDEAQAHLDVIEIDAASNRRIDEIRDLRDKVHIAPTSSKYKVYIIDEVHMLTREAFNALLKTLEEPPTHAIFILATTEVHKVPETIVSRTQKFVFKPIHKDAAIKHLQHIAEKENISISKEALELIAQHSRGSFRDSINMLDQAAATNAHVAVVDVQATLGLAPDELMTALQKAIEEQNPKDILGLVSEARIKGVHAGTLSHALIDQTRNEIAKGLPLTPRTVQMLQALAMVPASPDQYLSLELALLSVLATDETSASATKTQKEGGRTTAEYVEPTITPVVTPSASLTATKPTTVPSPERTQPAIASTTRPDSPSSMTDELWSTILQNIKGTHNTLYGTLRMATPHFDGKTLTLMCRFAFHQKQLSQAHNIERIHATVEAAIGRSVAIHCIVDKNIQEEHNVETQPIAQNADHLSDVSNIFDGAELLE